MAKMIELNDNIMMSANHLVRTNNGYVKISTLKIDDEIIGFDGNTIKITKLIKCGKRPDAPIIGKTIKK